MKKIGDPRFKHPLIQTKRFISPPLEGQFCPMIHCTAWLFCVSLLRALYLEMTIVMPFYKELINQHTQTHAALCPLVCHSVPSHHLKAIILWMVM